MDHWTSACNLLIDGTGTLSKKHTAFTSNCPSHAIDTHLNVITGTDNKDYIDWCSALGANIDGFNSCTLPHILEIKCAEIITKRFPVDKIKILKSGSDACHAAVRIARAVTNKHHIYGMGYHGFLEPFIASEQPAAGCIPGLYQKFQNIEDMIDCIKINGRDTAAVIVEPLELDDSLEWYSKLRTLRSLCKQKNILFIADEIITGDRYPGFSVSKTQLLDPDIMCLGKGLGGGHPIGIVGCTKTVAEEAEYKQVFLSTTFSGELTGLKALHKHLKEWDEVRLELLWLRGARLLKTFNNISRRVKLKGYPTRCIWTGTDTDIATYWQEMLKHGHLLGKAFFINSEHTDDIINNFLKSSRDILWHLKKYKLNGPLPRPAFKR